jgi:hypothetical protein
MYKGITQYTSLMSGVWYLVQRCPFSGSAGAAVYLSLCREGKVANILSGEGLVAAGPTAPQQNYSHAH